MHFMPRKTWSVPKNHVVNRIFFTSYQIEMAKKLSSFVLSIELVQNRSFTLTNNNGKQSRFRCLKKGVSQESVLAPIPFHIYTSDLPKTFSSIYAYADNLAFCILLEIGRRKGEPYPKHVNSPDISPQMENKAKQIQNGVVCLPP